MTIWLAIAALLLVALMAIVSPLFRSNSRNSTDHDTRVYQDQLNEIDSEIERGLLLDSEASALKTEISQRLEKAPTDLKLPGQIKSSRQFKSGLAATIIVILPLAALGLYNQLGSPAEPDQPFAKRKITAPVKAADTQMSGLVEALQKRLEENPGKIDGWLLLARSLVTLQRYDDAAAAFKRAMQLDSGRADIAAAIGETVYVAAGGKFTSEVRQYFNAARKLNPYEHKALFYLGLDFAGQRNYADAVQIWVDLIAISAVGAPWLDTVRQNLVAAAKAGNLKISDVKPRLKAPAQPPVAQSAQPQPQRPQPGPSQADVKAAQEMSDQDRQAFIRQMVQRLAERLKSEPNNIAGWQRLARAYQVLGETKKATEIETRLKALTK